MITWVAGSTHNVLLRMNVSLKKIVQSARKVLVLPLESELCFSTGTFWNNDDVIKRKLQLCVTYSTVGKLANRIPDITVETTGIKTAVFEFLH